MKIKIIFWGTGNVARDFIERHPAFIQTVEVVGFTDNDKNKWNNDFGGYVCGGVEYKIVPPNLLLKQGYDYILILSSYFDEIKGDLLNVHKVLPEKIISIDDADQIYVRNIHGADNGRKFISRSLLAEFAFSEGTYNKMLQQIDDMFSYYYLKEKYLPFIKNIWNSFNYDKWKFGLTQQTQKKNTYIWVCWLQGLENAPDIVKCCINSIILNVEGKVHIITYDNYDKYVTISEHIIKKHKCGIISKTHFSDILRLALLCKYGGIWMDATILMMDKGLPDYVYNLPIFMYRIRYTMDKGYLDPRLFTNWFIKSEKSNPVLNVLYKTLEDYWKLENECSYCLFHYILRLIWENYTIEEKYMNRLNIYDDRCRVLRMLINKKFDEVLWHMIKAEEPLQKLSYKNLGEMEKDSFYEHILLGHRNDMTK